MEKSIEKIWKEGFTGDKSTEIPRISSLHKQKSKHLVEKIQRMYKHNLIAIVVMALVFWTVFFFWMAFGQEQVLQGFCWDSRGTVNIKCAQ